MAKKINFAGTVLSLKHGQMDKSLKEIERNVKTTSQKCLASMKSIGNYDIGSKLSASFSGLKGILATVGLVGVFDQIKSSLEQTEQAVASLTAVTGNRKDARALFDELNNVSREIPQSFDEITQSALTLNRAGLAPTAQTVKSLGAISIGTGQSIQTVAQAFSNAALGQVRGLRQLGITAVREGDNLKLTYQGVTETIKADTDSMSQYINKLASTNFSDTLSAQMEGLTGASKVLGEAWGDMYRALGESAIGEAMADSMRGLADVLDRITANLKSPEWTSGIKSITIAFESLGDSAIKIFKSVADQWEGVMNFFDDSSADSVNHVREYFSNFFKLVNIGIVGLAQSIASLVSMFEKTSSAIAHAFSPDLKKKMAWSEWELKAQRGEVNLNDAEGFKQFLGSYNVSGFSKTKGLLDSLAEEGEKISKAMDEAAKNIVLAGSNQALKNTLASSLSYTPKTTNKPLGGNSGGGTGGGSGGRSASAEINATAKAYEHLQQQLEQSRLNSLSQLDQEKNKYLANLEIVRQAYSQRIISQEEYQVQSNLLTQQFNQKKIELEKEAQLQIAQWNNDQYTLIQADYDVKLALLEKYHEDQLISEEVFLQTRSALYNSYTKEITESKNKTKGKDKNKSSVFGISSDELKTVTTSLDLISQGFSNVTQGMNEQSVAYRALFAVQKSFSIASTMMSCIEAWANAIASKPFIPTGIAAYAQALSLTGSIISQVQSISMHDKGGSIPAGQYGIVGEIGPEIVKGPASVTSRKSTEELLGKTGSNVTVNLIEDRSRAGQVTSEENQEETVIQICVANIRRGGEIAEAMSSTYGLARQGI